MSDTDYYDANQTVDPGAYITPEGRLRVVINPQKTADAQPAPLPSYVAQPAAAPQADAPAPRNAIDKLLGIGGPRYELWPERMVRSALSLPAETMAAATAAPPSQISDSDVSPMDVGRVLDMTGLIGGGSIPAAALGREAAGTLGVAGGKLVQPDIGAAAGPFYSAVENAVRNAPQDKMSAGQWLGWLKNQPGVKQEELDWVGLPRNAGAVTKDEMLSHVQGHGPQIQEVEKSGNPVEEGDFPEHDMDAAEEHATAVMYDTYRKDHPETSMDEFLNVLNEDDRMLDRHGDIAQDWLDANSEPEMIGGRDAPRYPDYQLPGGDNYRELLLTMPEKNPVDRLSPEAQVALRNRGNAENGTDEPFTDAEFRAWAASELGGYHDSYRSSHWDEPNVLVHMRMNDRDIPDVGKSLHLEEVQSDWHQQGRKQGYRNERPASEEDIKAGRAYTNQEGVPVIGGDQQYKITQDPGTGRFTASRDVGGERQILGPYETEAAARAAINKNTVPDAPFKTTWPDLALKRAITKAAQEGYDAISWTPGEQQAARYDLSKKLSKVQYNEDTGDLHGYDLDNRNVLAQSGVKPEKLPDYIGKDAADKLLKQQRADKGHGGNGFKELSGLDLKVGGEGMKRFYDKMLVDKANALAKKFGGKVEYKELPNQTYTYEVAPYKTPGQGPNDKAFTVYAERPGPEGESQSHALGIFASEDEAKAALEAHKKANQPVRVPVLRLTPKMKDAALRKGMPLFASGLPFSFTPVDHDPFKEERK